MSNKIRKSIELLPEYLRTDKNSKFLSSTIDQLIEPPRLERINGYIGSKLTPTYKAADTYIRESSQIRQNYQLEPSMVIRNPDGTVKDIVAIDDLANQISSEGGFPNNFDRMFKSEIYSFDPHIDFDKFVNYQDYYWLTTGPDLITISGQQLPSDSTFNVTDNVPDTSWVISPSAQPNDPVLVLYRGSTYRFDVVSGHKFYIKTAPSLGLSDIYLGNVINNGADVGTVILEVDEDTPEVLYYVNDVNSYFQGQILVKNADENTRIDVDAEIVGKKNYTTSDGVVLSNGMKVSFIGQVFPDKYANKQFFVEGVGESITLVDYDLLIVSESLSPLVNDNFDSQPFDNYPFDNFRRLPIEPDYITINRASSDLNPWTRYNRWVHKDVIARSAQASGKTSVEYPADKRARRPIIEFKAGIKLYNFGSNGVKNVDFIDEVTTDAFSLIEGAPSLYIDGVLVEEGHRVVFNADTDSQVRSKIYTVTFVSNGTRDVIRLIATDESPLLEDSISVNLGNTYKGTSWWFNGSEWVFAQQKTSLNQAPLFDLFDANGVSYSDLDAYSSDFAGNKVFSYEEGTVYDSVLKLNVKYDNNASAGIGSWLFKNYFSNDTFSIIENNQPTQIPTSLTFLKVTRAGTSTLTNVWRDAVAHSLPIQQLEVISEPTTRLEITSVADVTLPLSVELFVNGDKIPVELYVVSVSPGKVFVDYSSGFDSGDTVLLKIYTTSSVKGQGWYESPLSLTNNPKNALLGSLTLTEMGDHLKTMIESSDDFSRIQAGTIGVRDIPDISKYGNRLVSNINPIEFSTFFIGLKDHNLLDAISKSADQYNQFKMNFLKTIADLPMGLSPADAVDAALKEINKDKDVNASWYLSDMAAYGGDKTVRTWTVSDSIVRQFPITSDFNLDSLTTRSVLVYVNGVQQLAGTDYVFTQDSSIEFLRNLSVGDTVEVADYSDTSGSYIPSTPTKLGLYPKFTPGIIVDDTLVSGARQVIQGHDGSITVCYGDYRDQIILELEKRIYNNIKGSYNSKLIDVGDVFPGAFRSNQFSADEVKRILQKDLIKWAAFYGIDYAKNSVFDDGNAFTWNYTGAYSALVEQNVSGSWRAVFRYFYDTDRPHTHPWEMLGFSEKPDWWESAYGPAPYTSGNEILWSDLESGTIRQGDRAGVYEKYARPGLSTILPVDETGALRSPDQNLLTNITPFAIRQPWAIADLGASELAWRRSSYWPFAVQRLLALTKPASYCSLMYDPSRLALNAAGQLTFGENGDFLSLDNLSVFDYRGALTNGYSVYVSEIGRQRTSNYLDKLASDLSLVNFNLFYKTGGFISKDKIQLIIDAVAPRSPAPGSILPQENYQVVFNVSNPVKTISASGIIVQKTADGFLVKGYDNAQPYFNVFSSIRNSTTPTITVGGISESFVDWSPSSSSGDKGLTAEDTTTASSASGIFYQAGQIVRQGNTYYRTRVSHFAGDVFESNLFQPLTSLPVVGGATVQRAVAFNNQPTQVPYGTVFNTVQEVYDLITGYGAWLETQGFVFDQYSKDLNDVVDWNFSAREFLYWTTQNWANNSVITLSPFAEQVKYSFPSSVVDNVFDSFYEYSIRNASGLPIPRSFLNASRSDGIFTLKVVNTEDGVYFITLNSVQKEHALVFDNTTVFNDTIYDPETGYRQKRMLISGFRTAEWDGDYFSPGFVYDTALISSWKRYTDYKYSDLVQYSGNYYSAKENVYGSKDFDYSKWVLLGEKPVADLIPNFDYKINQFEDFYSLDIDNFDVGQQQAAQHLVGYTPRPYLYNVFTNPIAQYKFYQGYIKEKGTRNAVAKLAKASIANLQGEIDFTEEWAFRVGQFGGYSTYQELEFPLVEGTFVENPQSIEFVDTVPASRNGLVNYVTPADLAISLDNYSSSNVFLTTSTNLFEISVAGFVNLNDVSRTALTKDELLGVQDNRNIQNGDVIWVGFADNNDWDVLRYSRLDSKIMEVIKDLTGEIVFKTDFFHSLKVGDIISITQLDASVNGIFRVKAIPDLDQFIVDETFDSIEISTVPNSNALFKLSSAKISTYDNLPLDSDILKLPVGSKFWILNTLPGDGNWRVYEKIKNYESVTIENIFDPLSQQLGFSISKQPDSNILVTGAPGFNNAFGTGRVFVFSEEPGTSVIRKFNFNLNRDEIRKYDNGGDAKFGYSVVYEGSNFEGSGYGLIIAGAPDLSSPNSVESGGLRFAVDTVSTATVFETVLEGGVKISSIDPLLFNEKPEIVLLPSMSESNHRFGFSVAANANSSLLVVGAPATETSGTSAIYQFDLSFTTRTNLVSNHRKLESVATTQTGSLFGFSVAVTDNGYIAAGAPGYSTTVNQIGLVEIYSADSTSSFPVQTLSPASIETVGFDAEMLEYAKFGQHVHFSKDGSLLFVSIPGYKTSNGSYGVVVIYQADEGGVFDERNPQVLYNPVANQGMIFGTSVSYDPVNDALAISSVGTNNSVFLEFDTGTTVFDSNSTRFFDNVTDYGTVYVYNRSSEGTRFVLAEELQPQFAADEEVAGTRFGTSIVMDSDSVFVGAPGVPEAAATSKFYRFEKIDPTRNSLLAIEEKNLLVDTDTLEKAALYDVTNDIVVDYLDIIDPAKGKIAGIAEQELKYRSAFDPAIYAVGNDSTVNDPETNWVDSHVGEIWWDLSRLKYILYEQDDLLYRKNNWGRLFPGCSIDIYEWVSSDLLPSEWAQIADTSEGLARGISGQPKYPDDTVYSLKQVYDSVSNSFRTRYYFWVKNKVTVPNAINRRISAFQVASIIQDPVGYGVRSVSLVGKNSLILSNVSNLLVDNRIHLNLAVDNLKNIVPRHTEWLLLQENNPTSVPNAMLEKKLIDSLLGHDSLGNVVPDPSLTERTKFGISIRPRQSMFKDRLEALRNVIEFANSVLVSNQITGNVNFENLNKEEAAPDEISRQYDQVVEDYETLLTIDTFRLRQAEISCSVTNGKISSITVLNPGFGYKIPPNVEILGDSKGAVISTVIDEFGRVIACTIDSAGSGFSSSPALLVRPYSVVVLADSIFNNKWSLYSWDISKNQWVRSKTQKYNTSLYWSYVDWVSPSYNQFLDYAETVDDVYEISKLDGILPGQYVKVKNGGDGRSIILEKTDVTPGTFSQDYNLVYSERGTIQISNSIWNVRDNDFGFDDVDTRYDQTLFDQFPDLELEYILKALKEDIFINELKVNWNLLFFKAVRYALTEQKLLDWAFKTSFINVVNRAGALDQRPVYKTSTSEYYEDYLNEVKPYHTQVRSYTTNNTVLEPTNTYTTDFDLPNRYNKSTGKFEIVDDMLDEYPWKAWADNYLYNVGSILIGNAGEGYVFEPAVTISNAPGDDTGSGASAKAYISSGRVTSIEVTNAGSNYSKSPIVTITGGNATTTATAYAQLSNGKIRSNKIGLKFDRISVSNSTGAMNVVDEFTCNGSNNEFKLTWLADSNKSDIQVILSGALVSPLDYRVVDSTVFTNGYNKKISRVVFTSEVPPRNSILTVRYRKSVDLLTAIERIEEFYAPTSGMPAAPAALMSGIEFPRTIVQGLRFDYNTKWDLQYSSGEFSKFDQTPWGDDVDFYKKVTITSTATLGTSTVVVDSVDGISLGLFANVISSTSTSFITTDDVIVEGINTSSNSVTLSTLTSRTLVPGDVIEFWSMSADRNSIDTLIYAGDLDKTYALGVGDTSIILDGDQFLSANGEGVPEELVPGLVSDTIGINVYTRNLGQTAPLVVNSSFDIGPNVESSIPLPVVPVNKDSISVVFNGQIFSYTTNTSLTTATDSTYYTIDWSNGILNIPPQSVPGSVGYTIISIGSDSSPGEFGVTDNQITVSVGTSTNFVQSLSSAGTIKSAYVTVNGQKIDKTPTTSTYYTLNDQLGVDDRATVEVFNLSTSTTSTIQAWFFGSEVKYFNEIVEQRIVYSDDTTVYTLSNPPGLVEPLVAHAMVEVITEAGARRLLPPVINYYQVVDTSVRTYSVINGNNTFDEFIANREVRVYLNGGELRENADWVKPATSDVLTIREGILQQGDVIAILTIPLFSPRPDFDIQGNQLRILNTDDAVIPNGAVIRVITYNNHDNLLMRVQRFEGVANGRFKLVATILNDNYLWVEVDGIPLVNRIDYTMLDDGRTLQLSDKYSLTAANTVVVTTIDSANTVSEVIGYRIFVDSFGKTHFKRLSKSNSTTLTQPLLSSDTEIHVRDSSVLTPPNLARSIPGVVIINGERIEYFQVDGNILKQLRRSTLGTGPADVATVGTKVIDQGTQQTIPYSENIRRQVAYIDSNTSTYVISTQTSSVSIPGSTATVVSDGITMSLSPVFDLGIVDPTDPLRQRSIPVTAVDQIQVVLGGNLLRKTKYFYHDTQIAYDSQEFDLLGTVATVDDLPVVSQIGSAYAVSSLKQVWVYEASIEASAVKGYVYKGLKYEDEQFTYNTVTNSISLLVTVPPNPTLLEIFKKDFDKDSLWNDKITENTTKSILDSTGTVAVFLQSRFAELPDRYYYGR